MNVLHITYDYPDDINPKKTVAVKNLIEYTRETEDKSFYISLNRVSNFKKEKIILKKQGIQMSTFGLPKGIFFRYTLKHSICRVMSTNINFNNYNLIHAHKLTFEGPIAYNLYKKYNIPYVISLRQTDFKILKFKPELRKKYKNILKKAKNIILISPWMKDELIKIYKNNFSSIENKIEILPNIIEKKQCYWQAENNGKLLMVLNMKKANIKIKNIKNVLKAIKELKKDGKKVFIDIIGDGDGKKYIENIIDKYKLKDQVHLLGKKKHNEILNIMKEYKSFILCSYPETFGLVYLEALVSGIPIIYTKHTGIYGYFNKDNIGIAVNHKNINEIKEAINEINFNYEYYKTNTNKFQQSGKLDIFNKENIKSKYNYIIKN